MGGEGDSLVIKPINKAAVHRICSGQVILDLASAVKELVENSLDSGASTIEINLKEYGEESFKVTDNGCGISPSNFQAVALKHHTSKISDFSDLQSLATFGFRGEALSSLCALGNLTIETRTKNDPVGTHLTFNHSGLLTTERKTARQVGTTVTVEKLFSTLPVRSKEFSRNIRREYGKLISLLNAYALIARGVRILCTNTTGRNVKSLVLKTQGSNSLKDNIITVFGLSTFQGLEPLSLSLSEGCKVEGFLSKPGNGNGRNSGDRQYFYVNGRPVDMPKVSKLVNELYRSSNSKQFPAAILNFVIPSTSYDVNVTPDKRKIFFSDESAFILSLRSEIGKLYSSNQYSYSLNRIEEPEKELELSHSNAIHEDKDEDPLAAAKDLLSSESVEHLNLTANQKLKHSPMLKVVSQQLDEEKRFVCDERSMEKDSTTNGCDMKKSESVYVYHCKQSGDTLKPKLSVEGKRNNLSYSKSVQSSLTKFVSLNKRKHENSCDLLSEVPVLRKGIMSCQVKKISSDMRSPVSDPSDPGFSDVAADGSPEASPRELIEQHIQPSICNMVETSLSGDFHDTESEADYEMRDVPSSVADAASKFSQEGLKVKSDDSSHLISLPESHHGKFDTLKPCSGSKTFSILQFKMDDLRRRSQWKLARLQSIAPLYNQKKLGIQELASCYTAATIGNSQPENDEGKARSLAAAAIELDRIFRKEYFRHMQVIGQFNLGFIIGKLDQDLFIIDQHAADEKYNFEQLSRSTILNRQPLLQPMRLDLSPEEEVVASMHLETIRKNGFVLTEDMQAQTGRRFLLKAVPFSKNITFGAEDVKELISTLADSQGECKIISSYKMDTADSVCPSRFHAMLASRACRTSVMIGDPLTKTEMRKILRNLADLSSPWNCPHGRPTMRHLADLTSIHNVRLKAGLHETSVAQ